MSLIDGVKTTRNKPIGHIFLKLSFSVLVRVFISIAFIFGSFSLVFPQPVIAASNQYMIGFVTWGDFENVWGKGQTLINEPILDSLTHVIGLAVVPTSTTNGRIKPMYGDTSYFPTFVKAVHAHGKKAMTYVYGTVGGEGPDGEINLTTLIANGQLGVLVESIKEFLVTYELDGIEIDFETPNEVDQTSLNALIDALYAKLNPLGKIVSIAGMGGKYYPDFSLDRISKVQWIDIMTYDMCNWPDSAGYKHATYEDTIAVMLKYLGKTTNKNFGFPANKLCMGIPTYGYDSTRKQYTYREIVNTLHPTSSQNEGIINSKPVWWNGLDLVKRKATWAKENSIGGMMFFSTGYDKLHDNSSLLQGVFDTYSGSSTPIVTVPPSVSTNSATSLTTNSAVLNGTLSNLGSASNIVLSFEYGLTNEYGTSVAANPSAADKSINFYAAIGNLKENTIYHFRSRAEGDGLVYGNDQVFTTSKSNPSLSISSMSLSKGQVGYQYGQVLLATGGTSPYSWAVINGSLPEGLTISSSSGQISGIPTKAGVFNFVVQVSDHVNSRVSQSMSITIDNEPSPSLPPQTPDIPTPVAPIYPTNGVPTVGTDNTGTNNLDLYTNGAGKFNLDAKVDSGDKKVHIQINKGVEAKTHNGKPINSISIQNNITTTEPISSTNIIGSSYEFGPNGAMFNPSINLTIAYDPTLLPEGYKETDLVIGYWNQETGIWEEMDSIINVESNTASVDITHFSTYAVIAQTSPASISVSNLRVNPGEVMCGDPINVLVDVTNSGTVKSDYDLTLYISSNTGNRIMQQDIFLEGGKTQEVMFVVSENLSGSYQAIIEGLSITYMVQEEPLPMINLLQSTPDINGETNNIESLAISYEIENPGQKSTNVKLDMIVSLEETIIDTITVYSGELGAQDTINDTIKYMPSEGWTSGQYSFQSIFSSDNIVLANTNEKPLLVVIDNNKQVSWYVLALIIGAAGIAAFATVMLILRQRHELVAKWIEDNQNIQK